MASTLAAAWIYHNFEKATRGNIVRDQVRISVLLVFMHFPMEASSNLLFASYANLQVASMLAAAWIYHNSEKAAWGNIVMDQIRLSALIVSVHSPTEASSKLLFPNYDNSKWPACWLLLGFIIILKKQHEAMQWWACMSADYIDTNNGGKNNNQCHQTECQVKMNCPSWASFKLSLPSREPTLNLRSNFCEHENGFPWSLCLICQPILNW